jgi:capsular polysaccharide export protein
VRAGWPRTGDGVAAWGHSPRAARAEALASRSGAPIWRIEDAWLRSVNPARLCGEPPLGLLVERAGMHYDPAQPSELEELLARNPLDDAPLLARAKLCIERLRHLHISKYNAFDPGLKPPEPGYVLVIDQVRGDASLSHGGPAGFAAQALFDEMLDAACDENPGARILIRSHPETQGKARPGHYQHHHAHARATFSDAALSPWDLLEGAVAVYTVSSQLGAEAILAGHKPRVFGQPFYAGWGLTQDQSPLPRRNRRLTRAQLFAAAWLLYPLWYDPLRDELCPFETVLDHMEAQLRTLRADRAGYIAVGMRLWKRGHVQAMFGRERPVIFARDLA